MGPISVERRPDPLRTTGIGSVAAAPRRDAHVRRRPARIEGVPRLVEVDHERGVIGGGGFTLARFTIDLRPNRALADRLRDKQVIDAHAAILVKLAARLGLFALAT